MTRSEINRFGGISTAGNPVSANPLLRLHLKPAAVEHVLTPLAVAIEEQLRGYLATEPRIDRVTARAKSVGRFLAKAQKVENDKPKYTEPLRQI